MSLLCWEKPKKVRSTAEHEAMHSADGAPPGTYVPNMSESDRLKWKAKRIGGDDPRIEVKKSTKGRKEARYPFRREGDANTCMVFRPDGTVTMSMSGKALFDVDELEQAILEVRARMSEVG